MESVFGIVIGGWIGQLEFFKKNATKDDFPKLSSAVFPTFSKKCVNRFFRSV